MTGWAEDIFRTLCTQTPTQSTCSGATAQPNVRNHMFNHNPKTILSSSMAVFIFLRHGSAFEMEPVGAQTSFSLRKHIQTAELMRCEVLKYEQWHKFGGNTTQVKKR